MDMLADDRVRPEDGTTAAMLQGLCQAIGRAVLDDMASPPEITFDEMAERIVDTDGRPVYTGARVRLLVERLRDGHPVTLEEIADLAGMLGGRWQLHLEPL